MVADPFSSSVSGGTSPDQRRSIQSVYQLPSIFDISVPEIEFIVEDLIPTGSLVLLSGESGCGKTTVVSSLAGAINGGTDFAGLKTKRCPILYLDRENPVSMVRERLERLHLRDGGDFLIWGGWITPEPPPLNSAVLEEYVRRCETKPMIIVDSLIAFHPGNENDNTETRKFMDQLRRLCNLGATVIVLHHTGKGENSKEYRGSSDIKGAVDICYQLISPDTSKLERVTLKNFKCRLSVRPELMLRYDDGLFQSCASGASGHASTHHARLVTLLTSNPGVLTGNFDALSVELGIPREVARLFLDKGVKDGTIVQTKVGSRGKAYFLADAEEEPDLFV